MSAQGVSVYWKPGADKGRDCGGTISRGGRQKEKIYKKACGGSYHTLLVSGVKARMHPSLGFLTHCYWLLVRFSAITLWLWQTWLLWLFTGQFFSSVCMRSLLGPLWWSHQELLWFCARMSRRCEAVRAGNRSPSLRRCQGLDKSCSNFTLRKMPCVNSCPWPECSDLFLQTRGVQPIRPPWDGKMRFCSPKWSRINELIFFFFFCGENPTVGAAGRKVQIVFTDSSPSCSLLPCLGQLALVAESLRQVSCRFVRGWSHLCLLSLCRTVCHSEGILLILHVSYGRSSKHSRCFNALLLLENVWWVLAY